MKGTNVLARNPESSRMSNGESHEMHESAGGTDTQELPDLPIGNVPIDACISLVNITIKTISLLRIARRHDHAFEIGFN